MYAVVVPFKWLCILLALWSFSAPPARAQPTVAPPPGGGLPAQVRLSVGSPATSITIRVEVRDGSSVITASRGAARVEETIGAVVGHVDISRVVPGAGPPVAIVRGSEGAEIAAVIGVSGGRPQILWAGRTDLHGDRGERSAWRLSTEDRSGDGRPDIVVGQVREDTALCGAAPALLFARALDPSGVLRPVVLPRALPSGRTALMAQSAAADAAPAVVRALRFVGVSSTLGSPEVASALTPPASLTDGDPNTYWAEGRGGPGRGELAVARWDGGRALVALRFTPPPAPARGPRALVVMVGEHAFDVSLPVDATGPVFVTFPEPIETTCVALVLDDAEGAPDTRVGFGEVEALTDLDLGDGIGALVAALVTDDPSAGRAAEWLGRLGSAAVEPLTEAWERLGTQGRQRALRAVSRVAQRDERAVALLIRGAGDEQADVRASAQEALTGLGPAGANALAQAVSAPGLAGEEAAALLVASEHVPLLSPLLAALGAEGGSARAALREAIGRAVVRSAAAQAELSTWMQSAPMSAKASVALGIAVQAREEAEAQAARELAVALLASAAGAEAFDDRWRFTLAAAHLGVGDADAWLATLATDAQEWMLRAAAIEALGARRIDLAHGALWDPYPRVRIAGVTVLAHSEGADAREALVSRSQTDSWPMVRVAALEGLSAGDDGSAHATRALQDDAQMVRHAAIRILTQRRERAAWAAIEARMNDQDEWPLVVREAIGYVTALCITEAGDALVAVIRRGARPGAWEPDVELAIEAIRAGLVLGGEAAQSVREAARAGSEQTRAALEAGERAEITQCQ